MEDQFFHNTQKLDFKFTEKLAHCLTSTKKILHEMNPEAQILKFSAKKGDQQFENLLLQLEVSGLNKPYQEKKNSLELSSISAYSVLYTLQQKL